MTANTPDAIDAVEFNNMVTPYTRRLFDQLSADGLGLAVVSCTLSERNRHWRLAGESGFRHEVLRGITVEVGPRRFAHLNRGIFRTLSRLRPRLLVLNGFYPSMLLGLAWARLTRTPIALRVDGGAGDMPMSAYHRLFRPLFRLVTKGWHMFPWCNRAVPHAAGAGLGWPDCRARHGIARL